MVKIAVVVDVVIPDVFGTTDFHNKTPFLAISIEYADNVVAIVRVLDAVQVIEPVANPTDTGIEIVSVLLKLAGMVMVLINFVVETTFVDVSTVFENDGLFVIVFEAMIIVKVGSKLL